MRDDLLWSDGTPITAHDIEFSFKVIMSSQVPIRAQRTGTDEIKYVKAYDDQTLVYFHNNPLATNVWNVNFSIIPKHIYEKSISEDPTLIDSDYHVQLEETPVTGGGFEVVNRDQVEVVLRRRESAYMFEGKQVRDKPFFETVRLRIIPEASVRLLSLEAGDIDEMNLEPQQWSDQTNGDDFYQRCTKARGLEWTSFSFQWNSNTPYFNDPRVRQAMTYAFDHAEMLHVHRKGLDQSCTGTYHPTSRWYPGNDNSIGIKIDPVKQDLEKAGKLLDEAGWIDSDGDGYRDKEIAGKRRKFEFTIIVRNAKERIDLCELLAQNLRLVGVACNVKPLESATLQDKMFNKQFVAAFGGWGTGADPDTSDNIWGSDQQRNFVSYSNPLVDEFFEEGRKLEKNRRLWKELKVWKDPEAREYLGIDKELAESQPSREDCYAAIHAILWRDQPYTWLFYRNAYHGFNKRLRGYNFSPRGIFGYGPGFSSFWLPIEH
jgi:peptide/nickel transport system substrate-binding protein